VPHSRCNLQNYFLDMHTFQPDTRLINMSLPELLHVCCRAASRPVPTERAGFDPIRVRHKITRNLPMWWVKKSP
jgi:hypothetical protein